MFNDIIRNLKTLVVENHDRHSDIHVYCAPEDVDKCRQYFVNCLCKDEFFSPKTIRISREGVSVKGYYVSFLAMPDTADDFMWTCCASNLHAGFMDKRCIPIAGDWLGFAVTYLNSRLRSPSKEAACILIGGLAKYVGESCD